MSKISWVHMCRASWECRAREKGEGGWGLSCIPFLDHPYNCTPYPVYNMPFTPPCPCTSTLPCHLPFTPCPIHPCRAVSRRGVVTGLGVQCNKAGCTMQQGRVYNATGQGVQCSRGVQCNRAGCTGLGVDVEAGCTIRTGFTRAGCTG